MCLEPTSRVRSHAQRSYVSAGFSSYLLGFMGLLKPRSSKIWQSMHDISPETQEGCKRISKTLAAPWNISSSEMRENWAAQWHHQSITGRPSKMSKWTRPKLIEEDTERPTGASHVWALGCGLDGSFLSRKTNIQAQINRSKACSEMCYVLKRPIPQNKNNSIIPKGLFGAKKTPKEHHTHGAAW